MNEWVQIAGWVLLHSLWQGSIVAIVVATVLRCCRSASPNVRYIVACGALGAMLSLPPLTAYILASKSADAMLGSNLSLRDGRSLFTSPVAAFEAARIAQRLISNTVRIDLLQPYFPVIVSLWLCGVTAFLLRAFRGWYHIRRLHKAAFSWPSSPWQLPANRLARCLRLRQTVRVVEFIAVDVPTVIGWMRPVIILPVAAVAQLSPGQVEAVLAHELAHVRRHDYLVNLLQGVAEAVLFFHPAIWWLSGRLREEREHCCDDLAIEICGDRDNYATALAELENRRTAATVLGLAATDGPLLNRLRRILQISGPVRIQPPNWTLTLALAAIFCVVVGGPQRSPGLLAQATVGVADMVTPAFRAGWRSTTNGGSFTSKGKVVFADDLREVQSISDGGSVTVQTRGLLSSRRVEMRASNGSVDRKYYINDSERPWTEESRAWFAEELPFLVRRSGVSANGRVRQIAEAKGVDGVLGEIRLLYTDSVRGRYFRALFETTLLNRAEATAAFTLAADLINSSLELGRVLDAALAAGLEGNEGFFPAVSAISSSAEKGRLLADVLKKATLTPVKQVSFLASAATIESNAGCAAVLDAFATRYQVAEGPVRNAFLAALETVDSNFERDRLRERLVTDTRNR